MSPNHLCAHISVCICTYKRPAFLSRLLKKLATQKTDGLFKFSVVVVDNDFQQSAKATIDSLRSRYPISLDYYNEPKQNIALARNMAVVYSRGDFVAFIDDDEFPIDTWLLKHFHCLRDSGADGTLGPVLPFYEVTPPRWVLKGKFYDRPTYKTGRILHWKETRTGNVLLKRDMFSANEPAFDSIFGSGGEDRDFFRRQIEKGYVLLWCEEAHVYESIPAARIKRSFMLRRALLRGQAEAKGSPSGVIRPIKSLIAILVYTLALPITFVLGHHIFLWTLIRNCNHLGKIFAKCGIELINEKYVTE